MSQSNCKSFNLISATSPIKSTQVGCSLAKIIVAALNLKCLPAVKQHLYLLKAVLILISSKSMILHRPNKAQQPSDIDHEVIVPLRDILFLCYLNYVYCCYLIPITVDLTAWAFLTVAPSQ